MSVTPGQENPDNPFDARSAGFRAYMLDGSIVQQDNISDNAFKTKWNQLDHANLISVNMFQNQRYGKYDKDGVARWKNYKIMVQTNNDEYTHYWLTDDTLQLNWGNAVDIPTNAHSYPMIVRDPTITHDQELLADRDNSWT